MAAGSVEPPEKLTLDDLMKRNVEAINRIEAAFHAKRSGSDLFAEDVASFCGSSKFIWLHLVLFAFWLGWNGLGFVPPNLRWDNPPFTALSLMVACEAIFLAAFIMRNQSRQQKIADQRNHLDLQINMLAEQESSQMLVMLRELREYLGMTKSGIHSDAFEQDTDAEQLAAHIEKSIGDSVVEESEKGEDSEPSDTK